MLGVAINRNIMTGMVALFRRYQCNLSDSVHASASAVLHHTQTMNPPILLLAGTSVVLDGNLNCAAHPVGPVHQLDHAAKFIGDEIADHGGAVSWSGRGSD